MIVSVDSGEEYRIGYYDIILGGAWIHPESQGTSHPIIISLEYVMSERVNISSGG